MQSEQQTQLLKRKVMDSESTGSPTGSPGSPPKRTKRSDRIAAALEKINKVFPDVTPEQKKALNELKAALTQRLRKPTANPRTDTQNMRTQLKRMINKILDLFVRARLGELKEISWDEIKLLLQDPVFNNLPNEHICVDEGGQCEALIHMLRICVGLRQTPKWETSDKRFWYAVALALEQSATLSEEAQANQHWKRAHTALMYYFGDMKKGLLPFFFNQSCAEKGKAIDFDKLAQNMPNVFGKCETDFKQKYKNYRDELKAERVAKIQAAKMKKKKEEEEARKEAQENAKKLAAQDDIIAQLRAKLELAAKTSGSNTEENKGADSGEGSSDEEEDDDSSDEENNDSDHENASMDVNASSPPHTPQQNSLGPLPRSGTPASMDDIFDSVPSPVPSPFK